MSNPILGIKKLFSPSLPCFLKHNFNRFVQQRAICLKRLYPNDIHKPHNSYQMYVDTPTCIRFFTCRSSSVFQSESVVSLDVKCETNVMNNLTTGTIYKEVELMYNHGVMENLSAYAGTVYIDDPQFLNTYGLDDSEYKEILGYTRWEDKSPDEVITSFMSIGVYIGQHNKNLSIENELFKDLISALVKNLPNSTDDQLLNCFIALKYWPIETSKSPHYLYIWKALDSECLKRYLDWSVDKTLFMMDMWFHVRLIRLSHFTYKGLHKLSRKCDELTAAQLVHALFIMSCARTLHPGIAIREYEYHIEKYITELSIEEIGIFAHGFFKTKTSVLNKKLLIYMMQRAVQEADTISSVTLAGISKIVRFSYKPDFGFTANDFVIKMMEKRWDTLSLINSIHLIHICTQVQFYNEDLIIKLAEKFCKNPLEARLKDMERIVFFLSLFNFIPPSTPDIGRIIVEQLNLPVHVSASKDHPLIFLSLIYFLSLLQVFPEKEIHQVIDEKALLKKYGNRYMIPVQALQLDYNRVLEGPPGSKHLLSWQIREYLARKHCVRIPDGNQKLKHDFDKSMWEVMQVTDQVLGKENYLVTYTLPHFPRADIIFRLDDNGNPLPIPEEIRERSMFDDVYRPEDPKGWYCAMICSRNMYMHNVPKLVGEQMTKLRQLRGLGYTTILIPSYYWNNEKDKEAYLKLKFFSNYGQNK